MKKWAFVCVLCMLVALCAVAGAQEYPLSGVWAFAGGGEVHGDGFVLREDGTGAWLEATAYEPFPLRHFSETDSTFTWTSAQNGQELVLTEAYADGRRQTYAVQLYGMERIHLSEGAGGGFYMRNCDAELTAYLREKTGQTAFDAVLQDYLSDQMGARLQAAGLTLLEVRVEPRDAGWQVFALCTQKQAADVLAVIAEDCVRVVKKQFASLWEDTEDCLWQAVSQASGAQTYYDAVTALLKQPEEEKETPGTPQVPALQGYLGKFSKNKKITVYEGPGALFGIAGAGKAKVSTNGPITCYGTWGHWLLVEYEISADKHRFGWIGLDNLTDAQRMQHEKLPCTSFGSYIYGVTTTRAEMTDDPLYSRKALCTLLNGTSVHCIGQLGEWMLVEGYLGQRLHVGFVRAEQINLISGHTDGAELVIDGAETYTQTEIYAAMEALKTYVRENFPGRGLMKIRYTEEESADADDWWQPDMNGVEGMQLFADLSDMSATDFEIASYGLARNYGFVLYRREGGDWQVVNYGYE